MCDLILGYVFILNFALLAKNKDYEFCVMKSVWKLDITVCTKSS